MKKILATSLILIGAQTANANAFLSSETNLPVFGNVKNDKMAMMAVGCLFAYVKNHTKKNQEIAAEALKGLAVEEIFAKLTSGTWTPDNVNEQAKRFVPENKKGKKIILDFSKAVLKHAGVNPLVDAAKDAITSK